MARTDEEPKAAKSSISTDESSGLRFVDHPRAFHVYRVTDDELENLVSVGASRTVNSVGLPVCFAGFVSFLSIILVELPGDQVLSHFVVAMSAIFGILTLIFFGRTVMSFGQAREALKCIKKTD